MLERKAVDVAAAVGEVEAWRRRARRRELHRRAHVRGEGAEPGQPRADRQRSGAGRRGGEPGRHVGAGADAADDEPFEQLLVGEHHDGARDAELFGQVAGRRQALARAERPAQDGLAEPGVDLPRQRLASTLEWYQDLHGKWLFHDATEGA